MEETRPVTAVRTANPPEVSLRRLVLAAISGPGLLPESAVTTLIQLTAMAHPTGGEGDIVSASFPAADLERLAFLHYLRLDGDGAVELL